MSELALDSDYCRQRQRRLIEVMRQRHVDLAILTQREHVQWLAGFYLPPYFAPAAALWSDGHLTVVAPRKRFPANAAASEGGPVDELLDYESASLSTMRNDQRQKSSEVLGAAIERRSPKPATIGVEYSSYAPHLATRLDALTVDIEPDLYRLRRRKFPDELALIEFANHATCAMYAQARAMIQPGVNELDVFNALQATAVRIFGERLTDTGNDYACNARGGPPRHRVAQAGELYILDLGPAYRGYYSDNARTFAVDRRPTAAQLAAWRRIVEVFAIIESEVRPGVRCRAVFDKCHELLNAAGLGTFDHHLGHGIGLFPHEAPHLNPHWDDEFEEGDVFTAEPGLYAENLHAGMRLENDYLVTANGVRTLTTFPLEL